MKNWRTTVFGTVSKVALACGMVAAQPAQLAFLPEQYRAKVIMACGAVWFIFGVVKDCATADAKAAPIPEGKL